MLYNRDPVTVAQIFDKHLDPSGLTLGLLREAARSSYAKEVVESSIGFQ